MNSSNTITARRISNAHDVLQEFRSITRSERRDFCKGLIQTAVALLKLQQGKTAPASRLSHRAASHLQKHGPMWSIHGNLFFFLMRILWGLGLPMVLGLLVLQCAQQQSNQSATSLLCLMEISVLFGELFAAHLLI